MSGGREYLCYTDGSCKAGEGSAGGWGFVIRAPGAAPTEGYGSALDTLAKVMEVQAVAEAIAALPANAVATVYSDNQPLVESLTKHLGTWRANGFSNVDPLIAAQVKRIADGIDARGLSVRFQWVRAHNGNAGNERADELARQGAREAKAQISGAGRARK